MVTFYKRKKKNHLAFIVMMEARLNWTKET